MKTIEKIRSPEEETINLEQQEFSDYPPGTNAIERAKEIQKQIEQRNKELP